MITSLKKIELSFTTEEMKYLKDWCEFPVLQYFSPVRTKYNKKGNWTALSIKGYSRDPTNISTPNVLGADTVMEELQDTPLMERLQVQSILDKIPGEKDRVRLMRLEKNSNITKHTDKVDSDIKHYRLFRLHIPIITDESIMVESWNTKDEILRAHMKAGECWYLDVSKAHAVKNLSDVDRIHLVIDVWQNKELGELLKDEPRLAV